jgi:hypothetical protein
LRAPAIKALLLQCFAFFITGLSLAGIELLGGPQSGMFAAALIQGLLAAGFSFWFRLAPWWLPIQLLFPPVVLAVLSLHLPSWIFFILFLIFLLLYWSSFRTQVPFYPSHPAVRQAVADLLPTGRSLRFIDIGSGFGGMALYLAALRQSDTFAGIEIAPLPWLASWLRARLTHSAARFVRGDYMHLNFAGYDVVYAYLSPAAMPALWEKAHSEMRTGCLLISYEFPIPGHVADLVSHPLPGGPALHVWHMG